MTANYVIRQKVLCWATLLVVASWPFAYLVHLLTPERPAILLVLAVALLTLELLLVLWVEIKYGRNV